ncbi:MAG: DUF4282 domain-containing protein [Gammaproteobacteria bacterium]|nr:DUF4282 domain-containing protein [Gammaproteobacteria bacterium]
MHFLLAFDRLITPAIIHFVYWLGITVAVLAGLGSIFGGGSILKGLFVIVVGPIIVRVGCEVLVVLFRINENLVALHDSKQG